MTRRAERVASLLKEIITEIILHNLNDPVFKNFISITSINISLILKKLRFISGFLSKILRKLKEPFIALKVI